MESFVNNHKVADVCSTYFWAFPKYRREMKGLDWGGMYRLYGESK